MEKYNRSEVRKATNKTVEESLAGTAHNICRRDTLKIISIEMCIEIIKNTSRMRNMN